MGPNFSIKSSHVLVLTTVIVVNSTVNDMIFGLVPILFFFFFADHGQYSGDLFWLLAEKTRARTLYLVYIGGKPNRHTEVALAYMGGLDF